MNLNKFNYLFGALLIMALTFTSCDVVEDADVGGTSVESMSGDWWIVALEPDGVTPAFGGDYEQFSTYNTAANDNGMWINDYGHWMEIQTRVVANVNNLTFVGIANSPEEITGGTVSVGNGEITLASYTTASNTEVNEIYFEAEFDWNPGVVYVFKGHKRTGFAEDENPHYGG